MVQFPKWSIFPLVFTSLIVCSSCNTAETAMSTEEVSWISGKPTGSRKHYLLTPTGKQIFQASLDWYYTQPQYRAMPANCANNVSDVLENVKSDFKRYGSELIPAMEVKIKQAKAQLNGKSYPSTQINLPRNEAGFIAAINKNFKGGKIPTGALLFGCLRPDCTGEAGDGHIGIIGDLDDNGNVQIYHNNWYRPANNNGVWAKYMVSKDHLSRGIVRQWMPTPWMKLTYENDQLVKAKTVLPAIDDLDPYNYYTTMIVIPEIVAEVDQGLEADNAVSEKGDNSNKVSGRTCEVLSASGAMNVRETPNGTLLGTILNGTRFLWLADEGTWSRVQVRINGKLYGAGGSGTAKAYIHSSGVFCR